MNRRVLFCRMKELRRRSTTARKLKEIERCIVDKGKQRGNVDLDFQHFENVSMLVPRSASLSAGNEIVPKWEEGHHRCRDQAKSRQTRSVTVAKRNQI